MYFIFIFILKYFKLITLVNSLHFIYSSRFCSRVPSSKIPEEEAIGEFLIFLSKAPRHILHLTKLNVIGYVVFKRNSGKSGL